MKSAEELIDEYFLCKYPEDIVPHKLVSKADESAFSNSKAHMVSRSPTAKPKAVTAVISLVDTDSESEMKLTPALSQSASQVVPSNLSPIKRGKSKSLLSDNERKRSSFDTVVLLSSSDEEEAPQSNTGTRVEALEEFGECAERERREASTPVSDIISSQFSNHFRSNLQNASSSICLEEAGATFQFSHKIENAYTSISMTNEASNTSNNTGVSSASGFHNLSGSSNLLPPTCIQHNLLPPNMGDCQGPPLQSDNSSSMDNQPSDAASVYSIDPDLYQTTESLPSIPQWDPIPVQTIPAGEYDIVLLLDNRETFRKDREYFNRALSAKGINVGTVPLPLGDVLWVARAKNTIDHPVDIVLDYIVERKRIDDFVASIKDNRWKEQKNRIGNSGIPNMLYLVEEPRSLAHIPGQSIGAPAVMSAKCSTIFCSHFHLQKTTSAEETVDWLATMTKTIKYLWSKADLYYLKSCQLSDHDQWLEYKRYGKVSAIAGTKPMLVALSHAEFHRIEHVQGGFERCKATVHLTYSCFLGRSTKTQGFTMKDVFTRMLMSVKHMSYEKSDFIAAACQTPRWYVHYSF
jgi:crossover junction endonuclease MUS81